MVDVSAPSAAEHTAHVFQVLSEIEAGEVPQILVINKIDLLPESEADITAIERRLLSEPSHENTRVVAISAFTGAGVDRLLAVIDELLPLDPVVRTTVRLSAGDGATLALLHEFGRVLGTHYEGEVCEVEAEIPESLQRRIGTPLAGSTLSSDESTGSVEKPV